MNYKVIAWGIGALILLVLVVFYISYSKYARQKVGRHAVNALDHVIKRTRLILIVLVLILAGDLGYGHFLPQKSLPSLDLWGRTTQVVQTVKNRFWGHSNTQEAQQKKESSAKKASSKKKTAGMTSKKAVAIVKNYYDKQGTEQEVKKYKFIKVKISRVSQKKVFEVGAYKVDDDGQLVQVHDYEVNTKGKFDLMY